MKRRRFSEDHDDKKNSSNLINLQNIKSNINELYKNLFFDFDDDKHKGFPGALPVSLDRSKLVDVRASYVLSPKADGDRCFLLMMSDVDGIMNVIKIDRLHRMKLLSPFKSKAITKKQVYVFDAEQVDNVLLLFDCLMFDNVVETRNNYLLRLHRIKMFMEKFGVLIPGLALHSMLDEKLLVNPSCDNIVFCESDDLQIQSKPVCISKNIKRVYEACLDKYKVDGVVATKIMCNVTKYRDSFDALLKWKQSHTIDFLVMFDELAVSFTGGMKSGKYVKRFGKVSLLTTPITMCESKRHVFSRANEEDFTYEKHHGKIVECEFVDDKWKPMVVRHDKYVPNSVNTVFRTCNNIEENITIDEF